MATVPTDELSIIRRFGPHLSSMTGVRLSTAVEPDRLVKTHCCFCGQQCGIQLKVRGNEVIGFEPWEDFPFNRGMLCPTGVKRYLQGSHPDRLTSALRRDTSAAGGFSAMAYDDAIARAAAEIARMEKFGPTAELIDVERLKHLLENWPAEDSDAWAEWDAFADYRWCMLRAVSAASFMQHAAGSNH